MHKKPLFSIVILLSFLNFFSSCKNHNKQSLLGGICDTTDTKFSTVVNPVMTSKCVSCHNNSSASGGVNLEGYDNVKANYSKILTTIKAGTMPQGSSKIDDCAITKIETWVNRGANNN